MHDPWGWSARVAVCALALAAGTAGCLDDQLDFGEVAQELAPQNSLPPPQTTNEDSPLFFSAIAGNAITVFDPDNATLTVQVIVTNGTFTVEQVPDVTIAGQGTFSVTLSGEIADLDLALDNAFYQPSPNYNGPSTLQLNTSDSNGETDLDVLNITVTAFNDPPVNAVPAGIQAAVEDVPEAFNLAITDVDVAGSPMQVTLTASNATLITLATNAGLSFQSGDGSADVSMTFSGTIENVNAALNGVVITAPLNYIGASTLVITSNDGGATGAGQPGADNDTINIVWAAVNDAPVNAVPGAQTIVEEGTRTFSAGNGNALSVSDVDATTALVQITLSVSNGALDLGGPELVQFTSGDGAGDATMTFNSTVSNLNSALAGTVYTPTVNFSGAATLTMTSNDLGNTGSGGVKSDVDAVTINVTAVNDPPVNAVPGPQTTNEDVDRVFSAGNGNPISVGDADAPSLQVTLTATSGVVSLGVLSGLTFQSGDGVADPIVTFTGTVTSLNNALNGARFSPAPDVSGGGSLAVSTSDLGATGAGGALTDADTIAITIAPVNDPPDAANDAMAIAEDAAATSLAVLGNDTVAPDAGETLSVSSVGAAGHGATSTNGTTVTYTPAANYHGTDSFSYTISDGNGGADTAVVAVTIAAVNDPPTAGDDAVSVVQNSVDSSLNVLANDSGAPDVGETLTITAAGTPLHGTATITTGNTRISYTPAGGYSGPDAFTYTISDGNGGVDTATVSVDVVAVITQPVNSLPGPQTIVEDSPLFFAGGAGNAIAVSDANNTSLTVQVLVTNGTFTLGATTGLTVSGNGTASVTASGTIAALNAGLDNARYNAASNYHGPATLTINSSDTNGETDLDTLTLTVTSFNDAPVNGVPTTTQAGTEDAPLTFGTIAVADVDLEGAELLMTLTANNGTAISLSTVAGLTFTAGDGDDDATMTFRGAVARVNVALNGLAVSTPANYIGPSTLVITSNDQGATGAGPVGQDTDTINIAWSAVNDAPVNSVPGAQTVAEDGTRTFSSGNGNALGVSDADASTALVQITLTASSGVLTLGDPALVTFTGGDGTADATMTFNATLANLNSALGGTIFAPAANFNGTATVTMTSNDLGNAGSGGVKTDVDAISVVVAAVNDAPIDGVPGAQVTNEDVARVFSTANGNAITVADSDATSLQVTLSASNGVASLGGLAGLSFLAGDGSEDATMTFSGTIAALNTALNGARFTPAANASGAGELAVAANDLGATGSGGALQDQDTIAITINPVNDPPSAVNDALTVAEDGGATGVGVLANDSALPDTGETLSVSGVGTALHGTTSTNGTTVTYTPAANYNGTDSFSYTLADGSGGTASATVLVTVTAVNDPPAGSDNSFSVVADSVGNSLNVLANDSGAPDIGETLTLASPGTPLHGTATLTAGNTRISYTPAAGYSGPDALVYTVSDGNGGTDTATVTLDVVAVITQPVNSLPGPQTIVEDSPLFFSGGAGNAIAVSDANNTSLTVQILVTNGVFTLGSTTGLTVTGNGTASVTASGLITQLNTGLTNARYNPTANYHGAATLTINSSDTNGESDLDTLNLTVTSFNDPPANAAPTSAQAATEDTPRTFGTISVSDVDLEGAALLLTLTANNGTVISLSTLAGLAFSTGDGVADATMTFAGDLASVNVALNGLTITSQSNYIGPSTLVITSNDQGASGAGLAGSDTDTVNLTWGPVNDPPVNAVPGPQTTIEETPLTFSAANASALSMSDFDAAAATVQVALSATSGTLTLGNPGGVTFTAGDGVADTTMTFRATVATVNAALDGTVYNPNVNFAGNATVTMVSNDLGNTGGAPQTDTDVVAVAVSGVNDAPVVTVPGAQVTNEDINRVFSSTLGNAITVADVDATSVQVSITPVNGTYTLQGVAGLVFQAGDGTSDATMTFSGTPAACNTALNGSRLVPTPNFVGAASVTVSVTDLGAAGTGGPLEDVESVNVTVSSVNDNPDAVADAATLAEDATATELDVLANDTSAPDFGETLTITTTSTPAHGTAAVTGGGTRVTYTPTANYFGADSFTYTISDGNGGADTVAVSITLTSVNDPPVANDDAFTVAESSTNNSFAVRTNDSALPDTGETLSVTAVTTPSHGTAAITGTGASTAVSYTPTAGYNGPDSFEYTLSDPNGGSDTATVSVTVTPVSTQPNAVDDVMTVGEDGDGVVAVLTNDTGLGDAPIVVTAGALPTHGAIEVQPDNTVRYTPSADYHGPDAFTYVVTDADGQLDSANVAVTVQAVDDLPLAVDDDVTTTEETAAVIAVLSNDEAVADLPAAVAVATPPSNGTATAGGDGTISYVPAVNFTGNDLFTYTVTDADGDASTAEVAVTVTPVNDAPVAVEDDASTNEQVAVDIDVLANDTDAEQNVLSVVSVTPPEHGTATINGDDTIHYVPEASFVGTDTFTYTISDGQGGQDTGDVEVGVGIDSDGDGLNDVDELEEHGTDPQNPDTDGDAIDDGDEVEVTGTDALDDDSDDDGLLDGNEDLDDDGLSAGETDALAVDSDEDGVQDGTESGLDAAQGEDTDAEVFVPDLDPASDTDPLDADTDDGGAIDGDEDTNGNGRVDLASDETDPNNPNDDPSPPDGDGDGVPDTEDNCPDLFNSNQADEDDDGVGNTCDPDFEEEDDGGGCASGGGAGGGAGTIWLLAAAAAALLRGRRRRGRAAHP